MRINRADDAVCVEASLIQQLSLNISFNRRISFLYTEGAHPEILEALIRTNELS